MAVGPGEWVDVEVNVNVTLGVAVILLGGGYFYWTKNERAEQAAADPKTVMEEVKDSSRLAL